MTIATGTGVDNDVARDLGDGGGDQRRIGTGKAESQRERRACARAGTMSASLAMSTVTSSLMLAGSPVPVVQQSDRAVQIEGGAKGGEVEVELHHGDGDIGLNADDDGGGASQPAVMAMDRNERATKESMTSRAATSTITPRARWCPTRSARSSRRASTSVSVRSPWIDAIR